MTFSTPRTEIDFNGASLFLRFAGREAYITRPVGQPLRFLSVARLGANLEVWGLGFYCVLTRV